MHPYALLSIIAFQLIAIPSLVICSRLAKKDPERYRTSLIAGYVVEALVLLLSLGVLLGLFHIKRVWGDCV